MDNIKDTITESFGQETAFSGNTWLIARPSTFADMILTCRRADGSFGREDLVGIACWCLRYKVSLELPSPDLADPLFPDQDHINTLFERILGRELRTLSGDGRAGVRQLQDEMRHLKVANSLGIEADYDNFITHMLSLSLKLLFMS